MKRKMLIIFLPILLFIFLFSGCTREEVSFKDEIFFSISLKKDGSISQTISFPTQEEKMGLDEAKKEEYIEKLLKDIKTNLFFSYFYNFYLISAKSNSLEYKIGGEKMNYILPEYDEKQKTILFSFYFADSKVWDFYHPKLEEGDSYKVERGFFVDKGISKGEFLFNQKLKIDDKEQTIGEYFYTILSTVQSQFSSREISKPSFSYKYQHFSSKLHTNSDLTEENGLICNTWNSRFEDLGKEKSVEIYIYSPNRAVWYGVALGGTIFVVMFSLFIMYLKDRKSHKKEKI